MYRRVGRVGVGVRVRIRVCVCVGVGVVECQLYRGGIPSRRGSPILVLTGSMNSSFVHVTHSYHYANPPM